MQRTFVFVALIGVAFGASLRSSVPPTHPVVPAGYSSLVNATTYNPSGAKIGSILFSYYFDATTAVEKSLQMVIDDPSVPNVLGLGTSTSATALEFTQNPNWCHIDCYNGKTCDGQASCSLEDRNFFAGLPAALYGGTCLPDQSGSQWTLNTPEVKLAYCFQGNTPVYLVESFSSSSSPAIVFKGRAAAPNDAGTLVAIFFNFTPQTPSPSTFTPPTYCSC